MPKITVHGGPSDGGPTAPADEAVPGTFEPGDADFEAERADLDKTDAIAAKKTAAKRAVRRP